MSTLAVNSIIPANAGSEDYFLARAWVNFNGASTVAIRADGNVSSITDNGTGDYTVNISSALDDANYALAGSAENTTSNGGTVATNVLTAQTSSLVRLLVFTAAGGAFDSARVLCGVTR